MSSFYLCPSTSFKCCSKLPFTLHQLSSTLIIHQLSALVSNLVYQRSSPLFSTITIDQLSSGWFFSPTLVCLLGFMRSHADFDVSRNPTNSLIFSLFAQLFSPPLPAIRERSPQVRIFLTIYINGLCSD